MKPIAIVGVILLLIGGVVLARGMTYRSRDSVVKIGDLNVTADRTHEVPLWAGGAALAGGVVLIAVGMSGRRNS